MSCRVPLASTRGSSPGSWRARFGPAFTRTAASPFPWARTSRRGCTRTPDPQSATDGRPRCSSSAPGGGAPAVGAVPGGGRPASVRRLDRRRAPRAARGSSRSPRSSRPSCDARAARPVAGRQGRVAAPLAGFGPPGRVARDQPPARRAAYAGDPCRGDPVRGPTACRLPEDDVIAVPGTVPWPGAALVWVAVENRGSVRAGAVSRAVTAGTLPRPPRIAAEQPSP